MQEDFILLQKGTYEGAYLIKLLVKFLKKSKYKNLNLLWLMTSINYNHNANYIYVDKKYGYCEINLILNLPPDDINTKKSIKLLENPIKKIISSLGVYTLGYRGNKHLIIDFDIELMQEGDGLETVKFSKKYLWIYEKILTSKSAKLKDEILHSLYIALINHYDKSKKQNLNVRNFYGRLNKEQINIKVFINSGERCYIGECIKKHLYINTFIISKLEYRCKIRKRCINGMVGWNKERLIEEPFVKDKVEALMNSGYLDKNLLPNLKNKTINSVKEAIENLAMRECLICGNEFMPKRKNSFICGKQICRNAKKRYKQMIEYMIIDKGYVTHLGEKEKQEIKEEFIRRIELQRKRLKGTKNEPKIKPDNLEKLTNKLIEEIERRIRHLKEENL